ncbi:hypothetical protein A9507_09170 [Methanobacterium sp. A39]|uniref:Uncharacterized protein n=1 Tax=Methanobacterium bryantii TaxID=2161 RepID=A0A2A2H9I9_METBR|nr:hypothetical protein A9507_09170 [Methanobacterium sp. A39]PAV06121.1 hypothetical protein ASJ80_14915 [Methanobacterium bryantii]
MFAHINSIYCTETNKNLFNSQLNTAKNKTALLQIPINLILKIKKEAIITFIQHQNLKGLKEFIKRK